MLYIKRLVIIIASLLALSLVGAFVFNGSASAESQITVKKTSISIGSPLNKTDELSQARMLVSVKQNELSDSQKQTDAIVSQKESLEQSVSDLKNSIAELNDMFVHINKYAPDSTGNTYTYGNCTLYVKTRRPDISNSWGNANTWYYRAQSQGWSVGTKPKKGAVATTTAGGLGHVAYVEGVSLDGQWVTVSEMNYVGFNRVSSRTVFYTEFKYIYELD